MFSGYGVLQTAILRLYWVCSEGAEGAGGQMQQQCHNVMHGDTDSVIAHCQYEGL